MSHHTPWLDTHHHKPVQQQVSYPTSPQQQQQPFYQQQVAASYYNNTPIPTIIPIYQPTPVTPPVSMLTPVSPPQQIPSTTSLQQHISTPSQQQIVHLPTQVASPQSTQSSLYSTTTSSELSSFEHLHAKPKTTIHVNDGMPPEIVDLQDQVLQGGQAQVQRAKYLVDEGMPTLDVAVKKFFTSENKNSSIIAEVSQLE